MRLIKDLGTRVTGNFNHTTRFGLYECPFCLELSEHTTSSILNGSSTKCLRCAIAAKTEKAIKLSEASFPIKSIVIHGDAYDYSLVEYTNSKVKVEILCNMHGAFWQTPAAHLQGHGCHTCGKLSKSKASASIFITYCISLHNGKYDYSLVEYTHSRSKVIIICNLHGQFYQTPDAHKEGKGCPLCAVTGFNNSKSALLYYLRISFGNTTLYKIGITNLSIRERFTLEEREKITVLKTWFYEDGSTAYNKEQEILKEFLEFKYLGLPVLRSGNTELFIKDILNIEGTT